MDGNYLGHQGPRFESFFGSNYKLSLVIRLGGGVGGGGVLFEGTKLL